MLPLESWRTHNACSDEADFGRELVSWRFTRWLSYDLALVSRIDEPHLSRFADGSRSRWSELAGRNRIMPTPTGQFVLSGLIAFETSAFSNPTFDKHNFKSFLPHHLTKLLAGIC